jgi:hypothetical protein
MSKGPLYTDVIEIRNYLDLDLYEKIFSLVQCHGAASSDKSIFFIHTVCGLACADTKQRWAEG